MKERQRMVTAVAVICMVTLPMCALFAQGVHDDQEIGVLKQAAAELKAADPKLSDSLQAYARMEGDETVEWGNLDQAEKKEELQKEEDGIKLLKQAAEALKKTNPSLAEKLSDYKNKEDIEISGK